MVPNLGEDGEVERTTLVAAIRGPTEPFVDLVGWRVRHEYGTEGRDERLPMAERERLGDERLVCREHLHGSPSGSSRARCS